MQPEEIPMSPPDNQSSHPPPSANQNRSKEVWADGLRGLAAFLVACHHFLVAFNVPAALSPADDDGTVHLWQWPVIRAFINPNFLVAIFYVLSGFVLSVRPLSILQTGSSGSSQSVRNMMASACFKRPFRLFPSATVSIVMSYLLLLTGGFEAAHSKRVGTWWASKFAPVWSTDSWFAQGLDMLAYVIRIWTDESIARSYNAVLWTMESELYGSIMIYVFIMATSQLPRRHRNGLAVGLWIFCLFCFKGAGAQFMSGLLLADWYIVQQTVGSTQRARRNLGTTTRILPEAILDASSGTWVLLISLLCGSLPYQDFKRRPWSEMMFNMFATFGQEKDKNVSLAWNTIASALLVGAVISSEELKGLLSTRPMKFLGRISFCLYLLHVPLLLSIGLTTTLMLRDVIGIGNALSIVLMAPIWMSIVIVLSLLLTKHVDEVCVRWGRSLEKKLSG